MPQEVERTQPARTKSDPRGGMVISSSTRSRPVPMQGSGVRTNLITVPIQDTAPPQTQIHEPPASSHAFYNQYPQANTFSQNLPPMHIPPPQQTQYYTAPPAYSPAQQHTYPYVATAPQPTPPYSTTPVQARPATQFDYTSAPPPQWNNSQQYYR